MRTTLPLLLVEGAALVLGVAAARPAHARPSASSLQNTSAPSTSPQSTGAQGTGAQTGAASGAAEAQTQYPTPPSGRPEGGATVAEQAGVGSGIAYGRAGVIELGGYAGLAAASNFTQVTIAPTVGWFFIDNFQLTGIVNFNYVKSGDIDNAYFTILAEPSYHLPFSDTFFAFAGVGLGAGYASGSNVGFALAPRLGVNVLIGRSGILTPAVSFTYNTANAVQTAQGNPVTGDSLFGVNIGYTIMW